MKISGTKYNAILTVNKKRCGINISTGPWVQRVNQDLIKISPKKSIFPHAISAEFVIENKSDSMTDYFESDCIRLLPGHPLYEMARATASK